ncbi:MAG: tetratricopeptide repeat protein [Acidobacteriota bacterium]
MLIPGLLATLLLASPLWTPAAPQGNWEEVRTIAETQHEIVLLLIEKEEFDTVPQAAREIFKLHFPENQEHRIVKEAQILSSALLHHNRTDIAHQVVSDAMGCVKTPQAKAELHKEQAFIYRREGKNDEALREFEESLKIEKQQAPQQ